ncbi:MAG: hypothetical protein DMG30_22030, partial [Acidobacteria bacterium]
MPPRWGNTLDGEPARFGENLDFLFVIEYELRRPGTSFEIEMHRQEPCLNGREGVPASVARIALQQASRGFGDLVDYGIFRDPS